MDMKEHVKETVQDTGTNLEKVILAEMRAMRAEMRVEMQGMEAGMESKISSKGKM